MTTSISNQSEKYCFDHFSLKDMTTCGTTLRRMGAGAETMEEVATRIVRYFRDSFIDPDTGESALALARCFKTESYDTLPDSAMQAIAATSDGNPDPEATFLTLLGTAGAEPHWNSRSESQGHQAIPLSSKDVVLRLPMICQLIKQLGLDIETILDPELMVDQEQKTFNVFHVPKAPGSPYIPAQDKFVIPYGIRSVLGFGGILPSGSLFVFILFSSVSIPRSAGDQFKSLALNAKFALLPFDRGSVFN
ncbi:MAG: hypothetical protein AAF889_06350 [Cyanobacteria bacterium P01_D01_bin.73]